MALKNLDPTNAALSEAKLLHTRGASEGMVRATWGNQQDPGPQRKEGQQLQKCSSHEY